MRRLKLCVILRPGRLALEVDFLTIQSFCDPIYTSPAESKEAIATVLPLLLQHGIVSSAAEVRAISLSQVATIVPM